MQSENIKIMRYFLNNFAFFNLKFPFFIEARIYLQIAELLPYYLNSRDICVQRALLRKRISHFYSLGKKFGRKDSGQAGMTDKMRD